MFREVSRPVRYTTVQIRDLACQHQRQAAHCYALAREYYSSPRRPGNYAAAVQYQEIGAMYADTARGWQEILSARER